MVDSSVPDSVPDSDAARTRSTAQRSEFLRTWLLWTLGFLAFPLAGLAGTAVAGHVDDSMAGLLGGAVSGLVIGTGQVLVSRGRLDALRWIPATTIGMALGLLLPFRPATLTVSSSQIGVSS